MPASMLHRWRLVLVAAGLGMMLVGCTTPNALLRKRGMTALDVNDVVKADKNFSQAVKQDPTDWKSQYYVGVVRLKQGRPLDAQIALEQSLALRPDHDETGAIYDSLAEAMYQQSKWSQLHVVLKDATDTYGRVEDYLRQGAYLSKAKDVDGAVVAYRKAANFAKRDDPRPYLALADVYEAAGDNPNALTALRQAFTIIPRDPKLAERIRRLGMVPGPTVGLPLDKNLRDEKADDYHATNPSPASIAPTDRTAPKAGYQPDKAGEGTTVVK